MKQNMQHATCRGEQAGVGREHAEAKVYVGVDLTQRKLNQELRKHKKCKHGLHKMKENMQGWNERTTGISLSLSVILMTVAQDEARKP